MRFFHFFHPLLHPWSPCSHTANTSCLQARQQWLHGISQSVFFRWWQRWTVPGWCVMIWPLVVTTRRPCDGVNPEEIQIHPGMAQVMEKTRRCPWCWTRNAEEEKPPRPNSSDLWRFSYLQHAEVPTPSNGSLQPANQERLPPSLLDSLLYIMENVKRRAGTHKDQRGHPTHPRWTGTGVRNCGREISLP